MEADSPQCQLAFSRSIFEEDKMRLTTILRTGFCRSLRQSVPVSARRGASLPLACEDGQKLPRDESRWQCSRGLGVKNPVLVSRTGRVSQSNDPGTPEGLALLDLGNFYETSRQVRRLEKECLGDGNGCSPITGAIHFIRRNRKEQLWEN
jgi:hypothetical protein